MLLFEGRTVTPLQPGSTFVGVSESRSRVSAVAARDSVGRMSLAAILDELQRRGSAPPDADETYARFETWVADELSLALYPAQEEALLSLAFGEHAILATPTGTGKSLVAMGAHFAALCRGERTVYTAPIKALVSEKFFALVDTFGRTTSAW